MPRLLYSSDRLIDQNRVVFAPASCARNVESRGGVEVGQQLAEGRVAR
jgi:hypothetical protein